MNLSDSKGPATNRQDHPAINYQDPHLFETTFKTREIKKVTRCPHTDKKHYCKGMCQKCYNSFGREHKAFNCQHTSRYCYARGLCHSCYNRLSLARKTMIKNDSDK